MINFNMDKIKLSVKVTKTDWQHILETMLFYNRKEGYVDFVDDKLMFFDSDPKLNDVGACHVTLGEVKEYCK